VPAASSSSSSRRRYAPRLPAGERREQVLDAALTLIGRDGYGAVTMEAVAREIGVTKPVVYDAFDNRGELLRALLEREEQRAFAALAMVIPALPPDDDPDALMAGALEAFLTAVRDQPEGWRLILLPVDGTPAVVRRHVEQGRAQILERLEELVAWGVERRGGPDWADPELIARAILGLGEETARLALTEPERFPPERVVAVVRGLLGDVSRAKPTG
jgi:AcrR family transcriptional regulator